MSLNLPSRTCSILLFVLSQEYLWTLERNIDDDTVMSLSSLTMTVPGPGPGVSRFYLIIIWVDTYNHTNALFFQRCEHECPHRQLVQSGAPGISSAQRGQARIMINDSWCKKGFTLWRDVTFNKWNEDLFQNQIRFTEPFLCLKLNISLGLRAKARGEKGLIQHLISVIKDSVHTMTRGDTAPHPPRENGRIIRCEKIKIRCK